MREYYGKVTKKSVYLAAALLLLSIAVHLTGFVGLRNLAQGEALGIGGGILPVILAIIGLGLLGVAIFACQPAIRLGAVIKPLLVLGLCYLFVQLILSLVMGGAANMLAGSMSGERLKEVIDLIVRIIQIPLRAAGMVCLVRIITGQPMGVGKPLLKVMGAYGIYTVFQYLVGMTGHGPFLMVLRMLVGSVVTAGLWYYVYQACGKAGEQDYA